MQKCPYCEAEVSDTAKKCKHCGEWVNSSNGSSSTYNINDKEKTNKIENDYLIGLKKEVKLNDRIFKYSYNQVFYKNNIVRGFNYYWRRILIIILTMFAGYILGIIPLALLLGQRKPRNKYVLIDNDGIGFMEVGNYILYTTKKDYLLKKDVAFVKILNNRPSISVYKVHKSGFKCVFKFMDIYEFDKLVNILNKKGYNVVIVDSITDL